MEATDLKRKPAKCREIHTLASYQSSPSGMTTTNWIHKWSLCVFWIHCRSIIVIHLVQSRSFFSLPPPPHTIGELPIFVCSQETMCHVCSQKKLPWCCRKVMLRTMALATCVLLGTVSSYCFRLSQLYILYSSYHVLVYKNVDRSHFRSKFDERVLNNFVLVCSGDL